MDPSAKSIDRRNFLKLIGVSAASATLAACVPAAKPAPTAAPAATQAPAPTAAPAVVKPVEVSFSWWGEDEAPGMGAWVEESIKLFEAANPNITVKNMPLAGDAVIPAFQAAQQTRQGVDSFFMWPGAVLLGGIWQGGCAGLDQLMADDLKHIPARVSSWAKWNGNVYAVPFYGIAMWNVYNKEIYKKAGADPEKPPATFSGYVDLCKEIKKTGSIPYALGVKDQWACEWMPTPWLMSDLKNVYEWFECWLGLNGKSMMSPEVDWWTYQKQMIDEKLLPDETLSIGLYEGMDLFLQGKAASVTSIQPLIKSWSRKMGNDKIDQQFSAPAWGDRGVMNDDVCFGSQYLCIGDWSEKKEEAAKWLSFLRTPDRMKAFYTSSGAVIVDDRFDPAWLEAPWEQELLKLQLTGKRWTPSLVSPTEYPNMCVQNFMGLYQGKMTPAEAAANADRIMTEWRKSQPELTKNYTLWAENFKG